MRNNLLFILILIIISACNDKTLEYWDISEFNIAEDALKDGEKLKLLYTSQGDYVNDDKEHYYHYVVVSKETGDSVNILTNKSIQLDKLKKNSNNIIFVSLAGQAIDFVRGINSEYIKDEQLSENLTNVDSIESEINLNINKVVRDPDFDDIAQNDHPAIIGFLGIKKPGKNKWELL
ncbi:MAG: hypothetical protein R6T91_09800 [Bacteroidales bacterium]